MKSVFHRSDTPDVEHLARIRPALSMPGMNIDVPAEQLAEFFRRHHIRKRSLYGSVLRDDFRPDSDVDDLVQFDPGHVVGVNAILG